MILNQITIPNQTKSNQILSLSISTQNILSQRNFNVEKNFCFPAIYELEFFKSKINKCLINPKMPELLPVQPYIHIPIFT